MNMLEPPNHYTGGGLDEWKLHGFALLSPQVSHCVNSDDSCDA